MVEGNHRLKCCVCLTSRSSAEKECCLGAHTDNSHFPLRGTLREHWGIGTAVFLQILCTKIPLGALWFSCGAMHQSAPAEIPSTMSLCHRVQVENESCCTFSAPHNFVRVCVSAGQVMTTGIAEILNGYSLKAVLRQVPGEKKTAASDDMNDDSYLGNKLLKSVHQYLFRSYFNLSAVLFSI